MQKYKFKEGTEEPSQSFIHQGYYSNFRDYPI